MRFFFYIYILLVSCYSKKITIKNINNDILIDSVITDNQFFYRKVYIFTNKKYLNENRTNYFLVFKEDECLNCVLNQINITEKRDSSKISKTYTSERLIFDYQYWKTGQVKVKNILNLNKNQLYLNRVEYDSINNLINEKIYIFVKDTTLPNYEFKISGWFNIK